VLFYFLQEGKVWLDIVSLRFKEIGQLKTEMTSLGKEETGHISIPTDLVEKFAQIQTNQIRIGRANAIAELKSTKDLFSVLSSEEAVKQKAALDLGTRLKVEDAIEELMQDPKSTIAKTGGTGPLSFPVKGTDLELVYLVDDKERRLKLTGLRQGGQEARHA